VLAEFHKGPTRRYRSILHRPDGVQVLLEGGAWNDVGGPAGEVPHDIAHLVVEAALGLDRGVWGVLAAGGLFRGASILSGRQRPHAAQRAQALRKASGEPLNQCEVLVAAVCQLAARDAGPDLGAMRRATGARWWTDAATPNAVSGAIDRLRELGVAWAELPVEGRLDLDWPRRPV
jgi:hypothetical protein